MCVCVVREKKIQDLEARNAELKQQLWMVEAEVDTLRYGSLSWVVCGVVWCGVICGVICGAVTE
jgi:hypothetical protein